jgi:hypothetical protein
MPWRGRVLADLVCQPANSVSETEVPHSLPWLSSSAELTFELLEQVRDLVVAGPFGHLPYVAVRKRE